MNDVDTALFNSDGYDPLDLLAEKVLDLKYGGQSHRDPIIRDELENHLRGIGEKALGRPANDDEEDDAYWKARTQAMEDILKRMIVINRRGLPSKEHPTDIKVTVTPELT